MTALASGNPFGPLFGASELKARARSHLRRGLFVSGALHLALLAALMPLWGGGADVALRTLPGSVRVLPAPPPSIVPPRLDPSPPRSPIPNDGPERPGVFEPVIRTPRPSPVPAPFDQNAGRGTAGDYRGDSGPSAPPGGAEAGAEPVFEYFEEAPVPLDAPAPAYPEWAREASVSGRVLLRVLVGSDGRVRRVEIREGVKGLAEVARDAVARWVFRPARASGHPVAVWVVVPVDFRL